MDLQREFTGGSKDEGLGAFDFGVQPLEDGDGKGGGLACARLGLRDDIMTLDNGDNGALLNSGRTLETGVDVLEHSSRPEGEKDIPVSVDTTEKLRLQIHAIKATNEGDK